jgi:microcystin-dependent protein
MSSPYVGQIFIFAGNFAPSGWMFCNGQLLPISEYETLFNLIGTTYGGDGQSTFALPDMRGRVPVHQGQGGGLSNYTLAQTGGAESVTLNMQQIPQHNHFALSNNAQGSASTPSANTILSSQNIGTGANTPSGFAAYAAGTAVTLPASTVQNTGGNQPHDNIMPILTLNYCISLFGVFPTQ